MAVTNEIPAEIEVFGVSYERYALAKLFRRMKRKLQIETVLEMPASGAKAMPSLYSLGFASAGCRVTLVDADPEALRLWSDLGLDDRVSAVSREEIDRRLEAGDTWDLCWNFMVLPASQNPDELVRRMQSAGSRWLMFVHVNRFNVGFFMHRAVHRHWKIPWTHGDLSFFSPFKMAAFLCRLGIHSVRWGVVDAPPWPDSPGFRDLRLHRLGDSSRRWVSPYVEYLKDNRFPGWMKWVYALERLPLPAWLKLPYSHLYYILGRVDREAD